MVTRCGLFLPFFFAFIIHENFSGTIDSDLPCHLLPCLFSSFSFLLARARARDTRARDRRKDSSGCVQFVQFAGINIAWATVREQEHFYI